MGKDQQFLFLIQNSFLTQHVPTMRQNVLDTFLSSQNELVVSVKNMNHWVTVIIVKYILTSKKHLSKEVIPKMAYKTVQIVSKRWFLLNGKKRPSYHYLKRVREISQTITDQ